MTTQDLSPSGPIARQCVAHKKNGQRCRASAVHGATVCIKHGGAAPQVRAKAALRILEASDQAAAQMIRFMNDKKVPYAVRLRAAQDLLNRASLVGAGMPTVEADRFDVVLADVMDVALRDVSADEARQIAARRRVGVGEGDEWVAEGDEPERLSFDTPGTITVQPRDVPPVPTITTLPAQRSKPPAYLKRLTDDSDEGVADFS